MSAVKYRRKGVNVGDSVKLKAPKVGIYAAEYGVTEHDKFDVVFRQATDVQNGDSMYVLWLKRDGCDRTLVAKPSHLNIVSKVTGLKDRE